MMTLYASPLACSAAVQMVLLELSIPHEVKFVDIYKQPHVLIEDGTSFDHVNPKNAVPSLVLDSGELLTEVGVILQYVAELRPGSGLLPRAGTLARYRVMEWLSFVGSDVHKTIGSLFHPLMPDTAKDIHRNNLNRRLTYIEQQLAHQSYLSGGEFTIADAYLFVMIGWEPYFKIDLSPFPNLAMFHERVASRPSFANFIRIIDPVLRRISLPALLCRH